MEIKRASRHHLKAIGQLLQENKLPSGGVEETIDHFLIIRDGSEIIGCAGLEIDTIVPSHGKLCGKEEIDRHIDYLKSLL